MNKILNIISKIYTWFVIAIIIFAIICALTSCGAVDKLEASHYHYYNKTKALIVLKKKGNNLYCVSAGGQYFYKVYDITGKINVNDTINLHALENAWVFSKTTFIKRIK